MRRPVTLFTAVSTLGGAATRAFDLLRLLRSRSVEVSLVSPVPVTETWRCELRAIGCDVHVAADLRVLRRRVTRSIAIGMCDAPFLRLAESLRESGCKLVWMGCMNWPFPQETLLYSRGFRFDAHVFQSRFQQATLQRQLGQFSGCPTNGHLIHGEMAWSDWHFEPQHRESTGDFVVGKLARPDFGKWSRRIWDIYGQIDHPRRRALVMGVNDTMRKWIGPAPPWAEVLPPSALPARDFYRRLHCLIPVNYSAIENWPRVGLEAMACGVPIIAPRSGGWCEMIEHGENGFLAKGIEEFARLGTMLAHDEPLRQQIAANARRKLELELANPDLVWAGWQRLFASLDGQ